MGCIPVAVQFFLHYGYVVLFLWVAAEQLGMPIPSIPLLLAAGTLTTTHRFSETLVVLSVVAACLFSDSVWYFMGKRFGNSMVRLVCRLSFESATCVRKTENYFQRHGPRALLVAKFVPGLSTVAAPIAGQSGMRYLSFLQFDLAGALLWALSMTLVGRFFGDILKRHPGALAYAGHFAGALFLLALAGFLLYRVWKQQSFLKKVRGAKIEPEELKEMLDAGKNVYIIDLRHPLDYLPDPRKLPGATMLSPDTLVAQNAQIPRDQDVVLYCTCPSDATSAKTALRLRKLGIYRVRPLRGGYDGWKELGYPLVAMDQKTAA